MTSKNTVLCILLFRWNIHHTSPTNFCSWILSIKCQKTSSIRVVHTNTCKVNGCISILFVIKQIYFLKSIISPKISSLPSFCKTPRHGYVSISPSPTSSASTSIHDRVVPLALIPSVNVSQRMLRQQGRSCWVSSNQPIPSRQGTGAELSWSLITCG